LSLISLFSAIQACASVRVKAQAGLDRRCPLAKTTVAEC